ISSDLARYPRRYRELAQGLVDERWGPGSFIALPDLARQVSPLFGAVLHHHRPGRLRGRALQPQDGAALERRFRANKGVLHFDDFLSPEALDGVRKLAWRSTIWNNLKVGGYVCAYMADGLSCGLLFQIAEELTELLPTLFAGQPLRQMWAYKY